MRNYHEWIQMISHTHVSIDHPKADHGQRLAKLCLAHGQIGPQQQHHELLLKTRHPAMVRSPNLQEMKS